MDDERPRDGQQTPPDTGLKRLLTFVFIALVLALILAVLAVDLVIRLFDTG